ncbi:MAG: hypothetical protein AB2551_16570 [Candidatus Thiodiazotropha sp.]
MEFFNEIERQDTDLAKLKALLQIASLPTLCASINNVLTDNRDSGEIYCLWGQFSVSREEIRYGVRFALLNCPHALAWTITCHQERNRLVLHCTIDDRETSEEFAESIEDFLVDWGAGLHKALSDQVG